MTKMTEIRVQVEVSDDELRKWAEWHADHGHAGVAEVLYRAADTVEIQSTDHAECRAALDNARDMMWQVHAQRFAVDRGELSKPDIFYAGIEHAVYRLRPMLEPGTFEFPKNVGGPAVAAAQRVWEREKSIPFDPDSAYGRHLIDICRTAQAPFLALADDTPPQPSEGTATTYRCRDCGERWTWRNTPDGARGLAETQALHHGQLYPFEDEGGQ